VQKYIRLLNTIKYLKVKQIYFRLFYFLRAKYRKLMRFEYIFLKVSNVTPLTLCESIENKYSNFTGTTLSVLNLSKNFKDKIDWNYAEHGKLWTYNLTYFEYLKEKEDIWLIYDFIENIQQLRDALEPFPISLRGINWIKFVTKYQIKNKTIDDSLYAQYYILLDNLEYHLLGNHLLENGFSLLFGAYYFQDEKLYATAKEILQQELQEQILEDGGHFELSPMYHQLMLFRLLDCINLVQNNSWKKRELLEFFTLKAQMMLSWLQNITYKDGTIPLLNDSANKIAPTSKELFKYAYKLGITFQATPLNDSGYRKTVQGSYEAIVDIAEIGASYIPGHAHADTFNFELRIDSKPFIVDSGLSTYEVNKIRFYERSTKAHNTVEVLEKNSSEVWGGFRVANRAKVVSLQEKEDIIKATHDGYKGILHTRIWQFFENKVIIKDTLSKKTQAIFRLHFHPDIVKDEIQKRVEAKNCTITTYSFASEFNKTQQALVLEIPFTQELEVEIKL